MNGAKGVPKNLVISKNYSPLVHSTLSLFNALPTDTQKRKNPTSRITKLTLNQGFVFSPQVFANYTEKELESLIDEISEEIGLSPEQMNSSFHKSWKKVRDAPIFQLVMEQLFHYFTTYGYEELGVYDKDTVYIPPERLDIPELKLEGIKVTVIKGYTKKQLKEKVLKMLESGIALKSVDEVTEVAKYANVTEIEKVKNKEVRIRLYDSLSLLPKDPLEFLRFILFKTTNNTLLIINKKTIKSIKESETEVSSLFKQYDEEFGYRRLAEIFLRFKPLFLALKKNVGTSDINIISRLSKKYHKPLEQPLMNTLTAHLKRGEKISLRKLETELDSSNIFRKIRLASALHYRMTGSSSMLYRVRNGKGYAKTEEFGDVENIKRFYNVVLKSIMVDLSHLKGKKFFIPSNVKYTLPATEKQFIGNIPNGSFVVVPKDMIFGVYWNNVGNNRIDIDLSVLSVRSGKIGWDRRYRSDGILFSGDVTDAANGASELFYINKDFEDTLLLYANYFNYSERIPVPIKIIVVEEHPNSFGHNYMVNPNHIQCLSKATLDERQKVLGLIKVTEGECRYYFSNVNMGNSRTSSDNEYSEITRDFLVQSTTNMITLNDVLEMAGAKVVSEKGKDVTDLSPEQIEKDTFISLLTGKE